MSTAAEVETVWDDVWQSVDIAAITGRIYKYAITDSSEAEIEKLLYLTKINFIQALTHRAQRFEMIGAIVYSYLIDVQYVRGKDTTGQAWTDVRDFFDTLWSVVRSELTANWTNTVDYWRPQEAPAEITEGEIAGEKVWIGKFQFNATKQV